MLTLAFMVCYNLALRTVHAKDYCTHPGTYHINVILQKAVDLDVRDWPLIEASSTINMMWEVQ